MKSVGLRPLVAECSVVKAKSVSQWFALVVSFANYTHNIRKVCIQIQ